MRANVAYRDIYCGIPSEYKQIQFTTLHHVEWEIYDFAKLSPASQYVVLTNISSDDFEELCSRQQQLLATALFSSFDFFTKYNIVVLRLIMPSMADAVALDGFTWLFDTKAKDMGMDMCSFGWGGSVDQVTPRRIKAPDECLILSSSDDNMGDDNSDEADEWPTLIMETGRIESAARLRVDADWWLKNAPGVNFVLLLCVDVNREQVIIEKWEKIAFSSFSSSMIAPQVTEAVTINEYGAFGALCLPFVGLFNRLPQGCEEDFVFGPELYDALWGNIKRG